jgi:hypothetical protein
MLYQLQGMVNHAPQHSAKNKQAPLIHRRNNRIEKFFVQTYG